MIVPEPPDYLEIDCPQEPQVGDIMDGPFSRKIYDPQPYAPHHPWRCVGNSRSHALERQRLGLGP